MNSTTMIYFLANFTTQAPTKASNVNITITYFHESTGIIISIVYSSLFLLLLLVHFAIRHSIIESHHSCMTRIWLWTQDVYQHIMWELFSAAQIPFWAVAAGRMLNFAPHDHLSRNFSITIIGYQITRLIMAVIFSIVVDHPSGCPCKWKYEESTKHVVFLFHLPGEIFHFIVSIYYCIFIYQHRTHDISDEKRNDKWDDDDHIDFPMANAAIVMAIFNLHFIIMHYIHTWNIAKNQQQQTCIQIMQRHMQRYGHIFMSQQAQFEFLLGTLPGAGAQSSIYHAFRCDPLYDSKLISMIFDMAFPIDPITRSSTFVSSSQHTHQPIHKQIIQSGDMTQPIVRLRSYENNHINIGEDQDQDNHNNNLTPLGSTSLVNSYLPQQLVSHFGFMYDNIPSSLHDSSNPTHDLQWCLLRFQLMLHSSTLLKQQIDQLSAPDKDFLSFHSDAYLYCRPHRQLSQMMEIHTNATVKDVNMIESRKNISLDKIQQITISNALCNTATKTNFPDMSVSSHVKTAIETVCPNHVMTIHLPPYRSRSSTPTLTLAYEYA